MALSENEMPDATVRVAWVALPLEFFLGGAVLGVFTAVTMLFGRGDDYDGIVSFFGAAIFGSGLAGLAMVLAFVVGLPLRLFRRLRHWWVTRGWVYAIVCAGLGMLGMLVGIAGPNLGVYLGSMCLAALGLCHIMRPMKRVYSVGRRE